MASHGKGLRGGSKDLVVQELRQRLSNVSSRVRQVHEQGSSVTDTAMVNRLANLNIIPGRCGDEATFGAARVWATVANQEGVVTSLRPDAAGEMTERGLPALTKVY